MKLRHVGDDGQKCDGVLLLLQKLSCEDTKLVVVTGDLSETELSLGHYRSGDCCSFLMKQTLSPF